MVTSFLFIFLIWVACMAVINIAIFIFKNRSFNPSSAVNDFTAYTPTTHRIERPKGHPATNIFK